MLWKLLGLQRLLDELFDERGWLNFDLPRPHDWTCDDAPAAVFKPGDKVLHKKFGEGRVLVLTGQGSDTRISIHFTAYGDKQFALHVAPIVKLG